MTTPEIQLDLLDRMVRIRQFELKVRELFFNSRLPGFVHTCLGEEAIAAGVCAPLRIDDYITSTHRGHGHCIAKGLRFDRMFAELMGREDGYCRGRGGSMHVADYSMGVMGANGIVGGGLPIAAGLGVACQMAGKDQVTVCFFGDGAAAQGVFHESLNIASLWRLPVLFVCENNQYGEWTHWSAQHAISDLALRAQAYEMPGHSVNGMNVLEVWEAATRAIERARDGKGPSLLVCSTYRYDGHGVGDSKKHRSEDEIQTWRERDPIDTFVESMINDGVISRAEFETRDALIAKEIEAAVRYAEASPFPSPDSAREYIWA